LTEKFNIYCDESCHLEHDGQKVMVLGSISCPESKSREISLQIKDLLIKHNLNEHYESKWVKVSRSKLDYYKDLVSLFYDNPNLSFRSIVVLDKSKLKHEDFHQTHDTFYYKMYYELLKPLLSNNLFNIYLDIKDTKSKKKMEFLRTIIIRKFPDCKGVKIQTVRSHEVRILQITDILIGAISYINRNLSTSKAKLEFIHFLQQKTNLKFRASTSLGRQKINNFFWEPTE
jgi:hypothetical protein